MPPVTCHPEHVDRKYKAKGMCVQCYARHQGQVKKARRHAGARRMLTNELLPGAKKRNHKRTGNPIGAPRINPLPFSRQPISQEAIEIATTNPEITVPAMQEVLAPKIERDELGRIQRGSVGVNGANFSPGRKMATWMRAKLAELDPMDKQGRTRMEVVFLNLYAIASANDPKYRREAIWAFNALAERALGKPMKDQSELEAEANNGLRFIIMNQPVIDNSKVPQPVVLQTIPDFIEG